MTAERDTSRIVRSWLRTDEHESADRILHTVLASLDTTPQRRPLWPAWRSKPMNLFTKAAIGAAAVLVVAVIGLRFLPASSLGPGGPVPSPSPSLQASYPPLDGENLAPGTYRGLLEKLHLAITVTVPEGWDGFPEVGLAAHDSRPPTVVHGLWFWRVENLYADPLDPESGTLDPPVGASVDDLVSALAGHDGWTTTRPTDVTVGGHPGKVLELTVPADAEFQGCDRNGNSSRPFAIWTEGGGSWRCMQGPGQTDRVYVLDVDGERVVITLVGFPDRSGSHQRDLQGMIDSLTFETP